MIRTRAVCIKEKIRVPVQSDISLEEQRGIQQKIVQGYIFDYMERVSLKQEVSAEIKEVDKKISGWLDLNLRLLQMPITSSSQEILLENEKVIEEKGDYYRDLLRTETETNVLCYNLLVALLKNPTNEAQKSIVLRKLTELSDVLTSWIKNRDRLVFQENPDTDYPIYLLYLVLFEAIRAHHAFKIKTVAFCYQQLVKTLKIFYPDWTLPLPFTENILVTLLEDLRLYPSKCTLLVQWVRTLLQHQTSGFSSSLISELSKKINLHAVSTLERFYAYFEFISPDTAMTQKLFPWVFSDNATLGQSIKEILAALSSQNPRSVQSLFKTLLPLINRLWGYFTSEHSLLVHNKLAQILEDCIQKIKTIPLSAQTPATPKILLYWEEVLQRCIQQESLGWVYGTRDHLEDYIEYSKLACFYRKFFVSALPIYSEEPRTNSVIFETPPHIILQSYLSPLGCLKEKEGVPSAIHLKNNFRYFSGLPLNPDVTLEEYNRQTKQLSSMLQVMQESSLFFEKNQTYFTLLEKYYFLHLGYQEDTNFIHLLIKSFISSYATLIAEYQRSLKQSWQDSLTDTPITPDFFECFFEKYLHAYLCSNICLDLHKSFQLDLNKSYHTLEKIVSLIPPPCSSSLLPLEPPPPPNFSLEATLNWPFTRNPLNGDWEPIAFACSKAGHDTLAFWAYTAFLVQNKFTTHTKHHQKVWRWIDFAKKASQITVSDSNTVFFSSFLRQSRALFDPFPQPVPEILSLLSQTIIPQFPKNLKQSVELLFYKTFYDHVQQHMPHDVSETDKINLLYTLYDTYLLKEIGVKNPKKKEPVLKRPAPPKTPEDLTHLTQTLSALTQKLESMQTEEELRIALQQALKREKDLLDTFDDNTQQYAKKEKSLQQKQDTCLASEQQWLSKLALQETQPPLSFSEKKQRKHKKTIIYPAGPSL